jgi:hypothetical protein
MVKKILIALLVAWLALLVFMPKKALYYKLEEELAKQDVKINEARIEEGLFSLTLKEPSLYVKGIKVATLQEINLFTLILYTSVTFEAITFDETLKEMVPGEIALVAVRHSAVSPLQIGIKAQGGFGTARGEADLSERKIRIDIIEAGELEKFKTRLQKDEEGWYYETSF